MDYFIEITIGGKKIRIEMYIEGVSDNILEFKETEFMYPVGSPHSKMFRVIEKNTKRISTCKRVTLKLMDPSSY